MPSARRHLPWLALACAFAPVALATSAQAVPYHVERGDQDATPRFVVTYKGSGAWRTIYHSEPPNDGGDHDTNDVDDSSTQRWDLRYRGALALPACAPSGPRRRDPCRHLEPRTLAAGSATVTGHVDHVHVDGLYSYDDSQAHCDVAYSVPPRRSVPARVDMRYSRRSQAVSVVAEDPVDAPLGLLPGQCPSQGDSLDLIDDNYFTPGFSFVTGYGPGRWFRSRRVSLPIRVLRRARSVTIPLAQTAAGTPPPHCAVVHPSYERCTTGGSWSGVLVLRRIG